MLVADQLDHLAEIVDVFLQTPYAIAIAVFSRISGELWFYIIYAHYVPKLSDKYKKHLEKHLCKIALGLISFVPWFLVVYYAVYGNLLLDFSGIKQVTPTSVGLALLFQLIAFVFSVRRSIT